MTLSTNTVIAIKQVLNEEQKPKWMEVATLNTIKMGVKHLKYVVQKDFLETCLSKKLFTSEITSIARKIVGDYNVNKKKDKIRIEE